jgi:hypothetical protein
MASDRPALTCKPIQDPPVIRYDSMLSPANEGK